MLFIDILVNLDKEVNLMISLCIPTYNRLPHLKECIESVIDKFGNYPYEVIVADGGSTDGTIEYLKELNHKDVVLIEQGKLTGITKAYNESFRIAKGDYIFIGNDDIVLKPEIFVKACKLMDKEKQIGMVSAKTQEPRHGNLFGIPSRLKNYGMLLSYFHIFRRSVLIDEMELFDKNFRSYRIDTDSSLSVLKGGHTIISTKEIALVHNRVHDEDSNEARATNEEEIKTSKEDEYFEKKWEPIRKNVEKYLQGHSLEKQKSLFFNRICQTMYYADWIKPFVEKNINLSTKVFNWSLDNAVIFKDDKYDNLKDFHLAQKYPEEIIEGNKNGNETKSKDVN